MKRLTVEVFREYEEVTLYSVKLEENDKNETDRFIERFLESEEFAQDFYTIISWIDKIGRDGALERYFRPEGRALAIPIDSKHYLRLYCYRVNDQILVLGNGGIKSAKTAQESEDCAPHFALMNKVANKIYWGIQNGDTVIRGNFLEGKLTFNYKTEDNE
ncbi:MAG: hypothetical protein RIB86_25980 [Imperialibacter sp.]